MRVPRMLLIVPALLSLAAFPGDSFAGDYSWSNVFAGVGLSGSVSCITSVGGTLVVGGNFDAAGPAVARDVAMWDGSSWQPMGVPPWTEATALGTYNGEVYGHGFLGQDIVKWDGTNWVSIATLASNGYESFARAMVTFQGKLVIGGGRLMASNGHEIIFTYDGSNIGGVGNGPGQGSSIVDMVVYENDLYVTGWFEMTTDSIATSNIARWDGTTWTPVEGRSMPGGPLVEGIDGTGYSLAVWDGKLIIAGDFTQAGDLPVSNLCSWDAATMMWEGVGGGSPEMVTHVAEYDGALYAGGPATVFGGTPMYFGMWDGSSWSVVGGDLSSGPYALYNYDGKLAIGGAFLRAGDIQVENLALWDGTSYQGLLVPGGKGVDRQIMDLDIYDDKLIAVGAFEYAGMRRVNHVAAWDGMQWSDFDGGANDRVECLLTDGTDLIVGGEFTEIGGVAAEGVARWDGAAWHAYGAGVPGSVIAMCMHNGDLHIGGREANYYGFIRRWDGAAWQTIALEQNNLGVSALTSYAGDLVAASRYWIFPDYYANVARWDGADWLPLPSSYGTIDDESVETFYHHNGDLYIGGYFAHLGGTWPGILWTQMRSGRWDGTELYTMQPSTITYPPGPTHGVGLNSALAYAYYDGRMYVAGSPDYRRGAIWSSDMVNPWELVCGDVSGTVYDMVPYQGALYVAGRFSEVGASVIDPGLGTRASNVAYLGLDVTGIEPTPDFHALRLSQNHPNPFNPSTTIHYEIPSGGADITLAVYDVGGRKIRTLASGHATEGAKTATWDGRNNAGQPAASGLYFCRLTSGATSLTRKMMLLK